LTSFLTHTRTTFQGAFVQLISGTERDRLLAGCRHEAVHLEMRDSYALSQEAKRFAAFLATGRRDRPAEAPERRYWSELVQGLIGTGRRVRRARIISEPVTDYIRFEWAGTDVLVEAGEEVRWLPRRLASPIALPGNDFWLVDGRTVVYSIFSGEGAVVERQLTTDEKTVELCRTAFEAAWQLAVPHSEYRPK
jgi:hypothetical protein